MMKSNLKNVVRIDVGIRSPGSTNDSEYYDSNDFVNYEAEHAIKSLKLIIATSCKLFTYVDLTGANMHNPRAFEVSAFFAKMMDVYLKNQKLGLDYNHQKLIGSSKFSSTEQFNVIEDTIVFKGLNPFTLYNSLLNTFSTERSGYPIIALTEQQYSQALSSFTEFTSTDIDMIAQEFGETPQE